MKNYFTAFVLCAACACNSWAAAQNIDTCLEKGKREFAARNYTAARATFGRCAAMDRTHVDAQLSLGGVCLTQDDLACAQESFEQALTYMKRSSPYLSYTYSMLGDIALKQQQNDQALAYYDRSLEYNKANVNSLVGKGVITEAQGQQRAAADIYQTALSVEPLNVVARKRLVALEPVYFTEEDILEALKQRYAVLPDKTEVSAADKELFVRMHSAEQRGGLDYLKSRFPVMPEDYIATLFKDTSFAREVLTLTGYNALQKQIGQDAVNVFLKAGVRMQDVFDLRDLKGNKLFLPDSTLSDRGFAVYNEVLQGRKAYLLPTEPVPPTQEYLGQVAARAQDLQKNGYAEISTAELEWVKKQTNCSEDTLRQRLGLYVLPTGQGSSRRYFALAEEAADEYKGITWYYVARRRVQKNPSLPLPSNKLADMYARFGANYKICSAVDGTVLE